MQVIMAQKIIVLVIVSAAVLYAVVMIVRRIRHRHDNPCGCDGCPGCGDSCAGCKYKKPIQ